LLLTLSKAQLCSFEPITERYRLGPRVLSWADKMVSSDELRLRSRTTLEQLSVEARESVGLVERLQNDSVCMMAVHSFQELRVAVRVGVPRPIYIGAPGKVLMAYLPEHEIQQILRKSLQKASNLAALGKQLRSIKARGFASSSGESVPGIYSLAVPILDQWGRPRASLALYAPDSRVSAAREKQWLALFRKAATELQAMLVHSDHSVSSSSPVAA
jgi:DNA-binding IclR family transcriptional regulator